VEEAQNEGVEAQNGSMEGLQATGRRFASLGKGTGSTWKRNRIHIRFKMKVGSRTHNSEKWIRIRIKVMRIRNPEKHIFGHNE
jgi:hypothetical protein